MYKLMASSLSHSRSFRQRIFSRFRSTFPYLNATKEH